MYNFICRIKDGLMGMEKGSSDVSWIGDGWKIGLTLRGFGHRKCQCSIVWTAEEILCWELMGVTLLGTNGNKASFRPPHMHQSWWCPRRLTQIPDTRTWMFKVCGHQAGTMTASSSYIQDTLWQGGQTMPSIEYSSSPGWLCCWPWAGLGYLVFYLRSGQLCFNVRAPSGVITLFVSVSVLWNWMVLDELLVGCC